MNTILVGYDLNKPGKNYDALIAKLKTYPSWWHHLDSTWLLKTAQTATAVRDTLRPLIDATDELLVINVTGDGGAWAGIDAKGSQWLKDNI
jgi:hypothetical protein